MLPQGSIGRNLSLDKPEPLFEPSTSITYFTNLSLNTGRPPPVPEVPAPAERLFPNPLERK
jgi:hypothetical protein